MRSPTWRSPQEAIDWPDKRPRVIDAETLVWMDRIEEMRQPSRRCSDCDTVKPLEAFSRNRTQPLGRGYICKPCKRVRQRPIDAKRKRRKFLEILGKAS